jgi:macrolide transport system ATP-binding/permease protein
MTVVAPSTPHKNQAPRPDLARPSNDAREFIRVENLHKAYQLGEVEIPVLQGVSFVIRRGELVALMGASGSGKTTLMNILGCLDRPTCGDYWLDGQLVTELSSEQRALRRASQIGFVFQSFNLLPRTTALNNVLMPAHYAPGRPTASDAKNRAARLLALFGMEDRRDHEPSQLSGGQQQRVAIARALVNNPSLILADEPTGNLDSHTSVEILQTFQQLNAAGLTVILVTHDRNVASFAHRTIHLRDGLIDDDRLSPPGMSPIHYTPGAKSNLAETVGCHQQSATCNPAPVGESVASTNQYSSGLTLGSSIPTSSRETATPFDAWQLPTCAVTHDRAPRKSRWRRQTALGLMPSTLRTAATALHRNKMRSTLTTLGIVIGIAAVIAMVEIGQGSSQAIQQTIATIGASVVQIDPSDVFVAGVSTGAGGRPTLTPADSEAILRECPSVRWAAPSVDCRMQVSYLDRNWSPRNILGTTPAYLQIRNWSVEEGQPFTEDDVLRAACVCLIGQTPAKELFPDESPVGKMVRVKDVYLKVVGVLDRKGANMIGMDQDDFLIAPLTTVKRRLSGIRNVASQPPAPTPITGQVNSLSQLYPTLQAQLYPQRSPAQTLNMPQLTKFLNLDDIWVTAVSAEDVPQVISEVTNLLRERHRRPDGEPDDFRIRDLTEIWETLAATSRLMTSLLLCVSIISLVVGGVGIMNIMLVSVTERTREIGLRMAVGARASDILWQFLVEAVLVCVAGGIAGIVLGRGVSLVITTLLHWPTMPSLTAVVAAVAVSMAVGVVFGYYPAWKASRLDPIEALRYE